MSSDDDREPFQRSATWLQPTLDEATRLRLGHQLQALYEPIIDESLDPRLAELMQQLDADRLL